MAKYDPLHHYLRRKQDSVLEMSFAEIERKIGTMLPKRASLPEWWENGTDKGADVQANARRDAGYDAFLLKGKDRVLFQRRKNS